MGGLNAQMEIVLPLRRIDISRFSEWAQKHLQPTDAVVIEATVNTWALYDIIASLVGRVVVANAYRVKLIAAARVRAPQPCYRTFLNAGVTAASHARSAVGCAHC